MRKRRISNWLFFALALSLHLALLAAAYGWHDRIAAKRLLSPLAVSVIIPAAPASVAPPASMPAPVPEKPPKRQSKQRKLPPKSKPASKQIAQAPTAAEPATPLSSSAATTPAPESAASPPSPPVTQAPVKTGVSVNASYVAMQTEKWYPSLSKRYGEEGTVVVRVQVSADGQPERVELKKRSDYPLLDEAAIGLAKSLKYNPAKVDGNPVADWVEIPITFRLRNP